jgi:hypothetical protein
MEDEAAGGATGDAGAGSAANATGDAGLMVPGTDAAATDANWRLKASMKLGQANWRLELYAPSSGTRCRRDLPFGRKLPRPS